MCCVVCGGGGEGGSEWGFLRGVGEGIEVTRVGEGTRQTLPWNIQKGGMALICVVGIQ